MPQPKTQTHTARPALMASPPPAPKPDAAALHSVPEVNFVFEVEYWQIVFGGLMADLVIYHVGGFKGWIAQLICLGYSMLYAHAIWGAIMRTQKHLLPRLHFKQNVFLKRFGTVILVSTLCVVALQLIDLAICSLTGFPPDAARLEMNTSRRMVLIGFVSIAVTVMMTGVASAQGFLSRLQASLAAEAQAQRQVYESQRVVYESQTRIQELELAQKVSELMRQQAELETEKQKQLTTEAELSALKMQINPHFLFNTLNSITALTHINPERAAGTTEKLAEIFHYALQSSKRPAATLGEEIAFLQNYFEIEKARFGSRIEMKVSVPKHLYPIAVPNLLLQPIVENAVAHGFKDKTTGCVIEVRSTELGDRVELIIADNGKGFEGRNPYSFIGKGTALRNINERLKKFFGDRYGLRISENEPQGAVFVIYLPYSSVPVDASTYTTDRAEKNETQSDYHRR